MASDIDSNEDARPGARREERRSFLRTLGELDAHEYQRTDRDARRLLRKLDAVKRDRGRPARDLALNEIRRQVRILFKRFVGFGLQFPDSLICLVSACMGATIEDDNSKLRLTDQQLEALKVEIRSGVNVHLLIEWARKRIDWQKWPGRTNANRVANTVGVSKRNVYLWRKSPEYRRGLMDLLGEEMSGKQVLRDQAKEPDEDAPKLSDKEKLRQLTAHAAVLWEGPVRSMADTDGKIYETPEEYARHLLDRGVTFAFPASPPVKKK